MVVAYYHDPLNQKPPNTPVARVTIEPRIQQSLETTESPRATISQKILRLQEEAAKQMPVIQQASQALNLCRSTKEFFGSSEQVAASHVLVSNFFWMIFLGGGREVVAGGLPQESSSPHRDPSFEDGGWNWRRPENRGKPRT